MYFLMWNSKGRVLKKVFVHILKVDGDKVKLQNKKTKKKVLHTTGEK